VAHAKTHGGVVAVCAAREPDGEEALAAALSAVPLVLLLEGVDDARNLGWTLRAAEALGVDAVLLKKHDWDFDEAAVARASSGAFDRLVVAKLQREDGRLERLKARGLAVWGCVPNVMGTCHQADLAKACVLAVGGEKRGLSGWLRAQCTGFCRIPMKPGAATSLSMSHAAAILVAEAQRQRSRGAEPATRRS
jgi:23S rRNA (guanosine2251-2'-O)-methyltransferase